MSDMTSDSAAKTAAAGGVFREFMLAAAPIRLREPLAETLGAFTREGALLEYSFVDAVKLAGHSCPTVTGAFMCCQEAPSRPLGKRHAVLSVRTT